MLGQRWEEIALGEAGSLLSYVQNRNVYDRLVFYEDLLDDFDNETRLERTSIKPNLIPTKPHLTGPY